ncbi:MAG: hypothetical protein Q9170_004910, partial [Blastenia crenularia]
MARSMTPAESGTASCPESPASKSGNASQLTPRSKVKAMLAAIDDASDSDSTTPPDLDSRLAITGSSPVKSHVQARQSSQSDSDLGEDDAPTLHAPPLPAPRGKVAARLKAQLARSSENEDSDAAGACSRLKKKLADRSTSPKGKSRSPSPKQGNMSTDEDDVLPAISRRRGTKPLEASIVPSSPQSSPPAPQPSSPGLFLTPHKEKNPPSPFPLRDSGQRSGSETDLPADPQTNSRFLALVARKREERQAKAEAEAKKSARRRAEIREQRLDQRERNLDILGDSEDDSDVAGRTKLSQQTRPTRKASKRALEEMNRETQRMSRNMQLAHQARTKKKITKESLFARFNFRSEGTPKPDTVVTNSSSAAASSNPTSEAEAGHQVESPPTSPMGPGDEIFKTAQATLVQIQPADVGQDEDIILAEDELPDLNNIVAQSQENRDEGKVQTIQPQSANSPPNVQVKVNAKPAKKREIRVHLPKSITRPVPGQDSDSDLEVLPVDRTRRKLGVFDRLPAAKVSEGRSLQRLRALAHLTSSDNHATSGKKSNLSLMEMQNSLQKRARQQAARERAEKMQELRDRGVIIQTAEERQKDQAEVEDLLEKARREGVELKQKEKDVAKKQAKANGETVIADYSSDEDEDYQDNDADESEIGLSGSDEEGENQLDAVPSGSEEEDANIDESLAGDASVREGNLIEHEASEASGEDGQEDAHSEDENPEEEEEEEDSKPVSVRRRKTNVIDDEEDEELPNIQGEKEECTQINTQMVPNLGLPTFANAPMGMTQAFAATMADSQTQSESQHMVTNQEEDSLAFLGAPPEPEFPVFDMEDSPQTIFDSQRADDLDLKSQEEIRLHFSQSQIRETPAAETVVEPTATQLSDIPDPTQDIGFVLTSPVAGRYASIPPSTVDTVILPQLEDSEAPVMKRKGRLTRKTDIALVKEANSIAANEQKRDDTTISADAFDVLKKGLEKPSNAATKFDKKKSNANEMVEEQAQESEDEYAGLGGASDDESGGEEDEEVRKMIDQGEVDVNEREMAAFYANKERASDEKAVEKLFKDINNGMLRRKRGADFDLSDSDDDIEARRQRKRREFAKMRKALLANENIGKIAGDPKKLAFLRAIEDRDDDEDMDFLEQPEEASQPVIDLGSQEVPDSQPPQGRSETSAIGKRKRPLTESAPDIMNRPPPAARRTPAIAKPSSLAEIRASVSFLIEEPDAVPVAPIFSSPIASDDEDDNTNNNENGNGNAGPRESTATNPFTQLNRRQTSNPVIDRLSLKRTSTSSSTSSSLAKSNLFFHTSSTNGEGGFK